MKLVRTIPRHLVSKDFTEGTFDAPGFCVVFGLEFVYIYKQVR